MSLRALDPNHRPAVEDPAYQLGEALVWLAGVQQEKLAAASLAGRLYVAKSGWLLLSVPNALVRGIYAALTATGAELPRAGALNVPNVDTEVLNAHISVMTADEVAKIGADRINERGRMFGYTLGSLEEITPRNIEGVSKLWVLQVAAPELANLRKTYGLSAQLNGHPFHITVALRRKGVLQENNVSKFDAANGRGETKAAAEEELPWRERVEVYTRQPRTGKIYGGVWDGDRSFAVPGGGIDPGETPEQAAVRELAEETGIEAANPVRLPIAPVDHPWSAKTRLLKAQQGRGHFAGSRTHFVLADYVRRKRNQPLDVWQALDRKFYTPEQALELMQNKEFGAPAVAQARMEALKHLIAQAAEKKSAATIVDKLPGGGADHTPDSKFPPKSLAEGAKHEREHTDDEQVAKEIAKDHLQEDSAYYEKIKQIEKGSMAATIAELREAKEHSDQKRYAHKRELLRRLMEKAPDEWEVDDDKPKYHGITHKPTKFKFHTDPTSIPEGVRKKIAQSQSVYWDQLKNMVVNPRIIYDHTKPVFENVRNHMLELKRRGDWILQARRNQQIYRSQVDPQYRHQLALQAFEGRMPQPASYMDQIIERYGDNFLDIGKSK